MKISGDEMRESTKYLMTIPFKFAASLSMVFIIIYSVLRFVEMNSDGVGAMHNDLAIYTLIMSSFFAVDGLAIMCMEYISRKFSETRLERYLKRIARSKA